MNKTDIIIPAMLIMVVALSGVFFLSEWQDEQTAWNLLSDEDQAMTKLAENLRKTDKTNCKEMINTKEINTNPILEKAIIEKMEELNC